MSQYLSQLAAIILGTFVSEDMTCISVGLLIRESQLHPLVGLSGCLAGIILGDFGVWLAGRIAGRRLLQWKWVQRRLPGGSVVNLQRWIDERCTAAVLAARLLPGTRAIMYLAIGALGNRPAAFLLWSLVAAVLWTPALVLGTALVGDALGSRLTSILGSSQWAAIVIGGSLLALLHAAPACSSQQRRAQFLARLSLLWRWEFWPSWLFYLPLIPWLAVLALRYRSLTVWTAANPGIPQGGVVGESKFDILSRLPQRWTVASFLIDAADPDQRAEQLRRGMQQMGWNFPLILKPDASQRGASVRRIDSLAKAETYFAATAGPAIAQSFHPGPYEAGIFYFRRPGEAHGRIFSITDKHFPAVTGDGSATLV